MILVTGATGFFGKYLTSELIKNGHDVRILSRKMITGNAYKKVNVVIGDITKPETLKKATKDIDTVFHLAGLVSYSLPREDLFKVNVLGTQNLIDKCDNVKKFVHSSSVSVYGEVKGVADEKYPIKPRNHYGLSKAEAERVVTDSGINNVILRIAPVYGIGSPHWKRNLKLIERGFPIPMTSNKTHVVHISEVMQAFLRTLKSGSGVYNIAGNKPLPFINFAKVLTESLGKRPVFVPTFVVKLIASLKGMGPYLDVLTMNRAYSIKKAEKEINFKPDADFESEMNKMINWYKSLP